MQQNNMPAVKKIDLVSAIIRIVKAKLIRRLQNTVFIEIYAIIDGFFGQKAGSGWLKTEFSLDLLPGVLIFY
jgi:hypothetical protein